MNLTKVRSPFALTKEYVLTPKPVFCQRLIAQSDKERTLHHAIRSGRATVGHSPHEHVGRLLVHESKVPEIVMSSLPLRHLGVWLGLDSVYQVWELDALLNEEHWNILDVCQP